MRDWPEPDQDTLLDILEVWDLGDHEEARAERAEAEYYEEIAKAEEAEANTQSEDDPYADWTPNACHCCGTTDLSPSSSHCQSCSQSMEHEALGAQYHEEYAEREKALEKPWQEVCIAQARADAVRLESAIIQVQANIARITADIVAVKSEIAKANYDITAAEDPEEYYYARDRLADAEIKLVETEASLVEAEVVLAKTRAIGAAHEAVARAKIDVKYAEAKVETKADAENKAVEFEETFNSKFPADEEDSLVEDAHIEFVNALIDLAEAKDALDLAEVHLTKTPSLSLIHGYGFASREPRCPTSNTVE